MKFHNPWIDPRIVHVRPEAVQQYLRAHGWECLGPATAPDLLAYDTAQPRGDKPNVLLPLMLDHPYQLQRMIELVSEVAVHEDRWAVDVLNDVPRQPIESAPVNGPAAPAALSS